MNQQVATDRGRLPRDKGPYCGFTLTELLIVMAIISLLAAMLLPVLSQSLAADVDSHNRKAMNCTYGDGAVKSLKGVADYSRSLYGVADWTWQLTSTGHMGSLLYWWRWAEQQR